MLLKRFIVLAGGVLLFIAAFIIYFDVSHMQMEARFKAEREKFHVEGAVLTPSGPGTPSSAPAPDANTPVNPAAPSAPDTNSAPATPPSSTMNGPRMNRSPFLFLASYRPSDGVEVQMAGAALTENPPSSTPP